MNAVALVFSFVAGLCCAELPPRAVAPFDAAAARGHQEAWAKQLATNVDERNSLGMTLVLIPPGEFAMGSSAEQSEYALQWLSRIPRIAPGEANRLRDEETPRHRVVLTRPFRLGRTEVTVGEYRRFVEATGYVTETERFGGGNSSKADETDPVKRKALWHWPGYTTTDTAPVSQLTWNDMIAFCNWLSEQERRTACYRRDEQGAWVCVPGADGYRLPTEAEWEYACRAGTTTHYSFGDDVAALDDHAWFNRTAEVGGTIGARPVATKRPNAFGLYDMHGNVWERCEDYFDPRWYAKSPTEDPQGPASGTNRLVRGGGWHYFDLHCRSAYRNNYSPISRTANTGFRVVRGP
ncbi:MAG: formylglycine-generating enzyme family protein [Planctomycetes bacterium]|nr:formylglycine-generating enzyme family protein [Planctomycetota bacterium]